MASQRVSDKFRVKTPAKKNKMQDDNITTDNGIVKMEEQMLKFRDAEMVILKMGQTIKDRLYEDEFLEFAPAISTLMKVRRELQQQLDDWKSGEDNRQYGAVEQDGEQAEQPELLLSRSQRRRRRWLRIREILIARDAEAARQALS